MKTAKTLIAALAAALTIALPALAADFSAGPIQIGHPYIIATPKTAKTAAGYFSVTNTGSEPDTLTAIDSDPMGMLHQTTTDANGVTRMSEIEGGITIKPGETVTLRPRGAHVMFMGLSKPFLIGDKLDAKLTFEKAGQVDIVFAVQARADTGAADPTAALPAPVTSPTDQEAEPTQHMNGNAAKEPPAANPMAPGNSQFLHGPSH